ncbi:MAG: replicative DNA helicase [Gammaproteobacteria bacterium]|nr:replicative DNA helicase [Gammaproteobacteria bacterium]
MTKSEINLKKPPQSREAEQSVLGGLLLDNSAWENVSEIINPEDFYFKHNRYIYQIIQQKLESNEACDVLILSSYFEQNKQLDEIGGLAYLGSLVNNTPGTSNIRFYAEIVRERSDLRQLIHMGNETIDLAFNPHDLKSSDIIEATEKQLFSIADKRHQSSSGFSDNNELLKEAIDDIEKRFQSGDEYTGMATGFSDFDKLTSGLQDGDLIIVAGRPSMGKTALSINIAENAALSGTNVAIFSLEMPKKQLTRRMLASVGTIKQTRLKNGRLEDEDWSKLANATGKLNEATYFIDDTGALSPSEARARLRRLNRKHKIELVIFDYIQLMRIPGINTSNSRVNEVSQISLALKGIAKEFNIPVIALSQLNRNLEQRPNKRPVMSDLRESGSLEQDADLIAFIYRDEVYNEDSPDKGMAEIIIGKQRNGPLGTVRLNFQGEYSRFRNLTHEW